MNQINVYKPAKPTIHEQLVIAYTFYCSADDRKSLERLRDEAEEGNLWAAVWLAECFFRGITNDRKDDIAKGISWLEKCGDFPLAQYKLAQWYLENEDARKKGKRLLKIAADGGLVDAHFLLGIYFSTGNVFKKNDKKAVKHFKIARVLGHPDANKHLQHLIENGE